MIFIFLLKFKLVTFYNKFLQQTGSQRPHRSCPLKNNVENIDRGQVSACPHVTPKMTLTLPVGRSWPPSNVRFPESPQFHFHNGIQIGSAVFVQTTLVTNRHRQTDRAATKTIGRSFCFCSLQWITKLQLN